MQVSELIHDLLELDQKAEVLFVRNIEDQLIFVISQLPNNTTKVCLPMPTAVNKNEYKSQEEV